jgi:hypothetical protein
MNPRFLAIGQLVVNSAHIVFVDLRSPGTAHVQVTSGNIFTFLEDEAAAVAAFFQAVNAPAPPSESVAAVDKAAVKPAA